MTPHPEVSLTGDKTAARAKRGGWGYAPNPFNLSRSWGLELGTPNVCRSARSARSFGVRIPKAHSTRRTFTRKGSKGKFALRPLFESGLQFWPSPQLRLPRICAKDAPPAEASVDPPTQPVQLVPVGYPLHALLSLCHRLSFCSVDSSASACAVSW